MKKYKKQSKKSFHIIIFSRNDIKYIFFHFKYFLHILEATKLQKRQSAQKLVSKRNLSEYVHWDPNDHQNKPPNPPPATNPFFFSKYIYINGGFSVKTEIRAKPVGIVSLGSQ